jgi:SRSO17 transposase
MSDVTLANKNTPMTTASSSGIDIQVMDLEQFVPELLDTLNRHFARTESRQRAGDYLLGLLSDVRRKNGWQLAEHARHASPDGIQWLLNGAAWDADGLRDDLYRYVGRNIGEPSAVLALQDVGFVKKGQKSVGIDRQRNGLTGKTENCQVAVFLAYSSGRGRALVDRELYLPRSWGEDPERRRMVGIPPDIAYRPKAAIGRAMVERACLARLPFQWVTGDSEYGRDEELRELCTRWQLGCVFEVPADEQIRLASGRLLLAGEAHLLVPEHAFEYRSHGAIGTAGVRDWAVVRVAGSRALLLCRDVMAPRKVTPYLCHTPVPVGLGELIRVAESRSTVVDCVAEANRHVGLDSYEVRKYVAWYRHVTMALVANSFLTVTRARFGTSER